MIHGGYSEENIHPGFSVDCVILSFHKGKIRVLLRDFGVNNYKALLGGFVFINEDADQAARRVLEYHTGLDNIFLKQFHLFSDPNRIMIDQNIEYVNEYAPANNEGRWLLRRFISMGYFALVKYSEVKLSVSKEQMPKWYDIANLPSLYSDHENIIKTALSTIKVSMPVIPVGYELLPPKFTMTELRKIYEIVLNKKFDRRNFQRKMLSEGNLIQLEERKPGKAYNPTILYSFKYPDIEL